MTTPALPFAATRSDQIHLYIKLPHHYYIIATITIITTIIALFSDGQNTFQKVF